MKRIDAAICKSKLNVNVLLGICVAATLSSLLLLNWSEFKTFLISSCTNLVPDSICDSESLRRLVGGYIFEVLALPAALLLERIIPAKADQPLFSTGLRQDVGWWLIHVIFRYTIIAGFSFYLYSFYDSFLSFTRLSVISSMPLVWQILTVVLLSDFLAWFHHWVRHKVPLFWQFHQVHHSQREMNYFCDSRIHPVDTIFALTISFIPFYSLELNIAIPTFTAWQLVQSWYTNFNHSNIRTNLGFLRYFLVTPQSHRIHHSIAIEHQDKNLGVIFSIWDFIFKTQHLNFDDYPDTGIKNKSFPVERIGRPLPIAKTLFQQLIYPFKSLFNTR